MYYALKKGIFIQSWRIVIPQSSACEKQKRLGSCSGQQELANAADDISSIWS